MYWLIYALRGYTRLRVTGAAPQEMLNRLAGAGIAFWGVEREDALHCCLYLCRADRTQAAALAERCLCTLEILGEYGLPVYWQRLRKRPVLLLGVAAAIVMCFLSQRMVLLVKVEGAERVQEEEIVRALEEIGIGFGTPTAQIDQEMTKHRMLNAVPALSWIGANREGFCLRVSVTERSEAELEAQPYPAAHLVARRSGIVTDVTVFQGMRLCQEGDAVREGQMLVSAYEDHGLYLRAVCAEAEIYARTWYDGTLVMPSGRLQKRYTGVEFSEVWLLLGRKRIKICGNSSISLTECDKMVEVKRLTLPGDYSFPIALEISTYRRYETTEVPLAADTARTALLHAWLLQCRQGMIAGNVLETESTLLEADGFYVLHAQSTCQEMIARLVPVQASYEGENS